MPTRCRLRQSIKRNPRVARFLYNMGRARTVDATFDENSLTPSGREAQRRAGDVSRTPLTGDISPRSVISCRRCSTIQRDAGRTRRATTRCSWTRRQSAVRARHVRIGSRYRRKEPKGKDQDFDEGIEWMIKAAEQATCRPWRSPPTALFDGRRMPAESAAGHRMGDTRRQTPITTYAKLRLGAYYFCVGRCVLEPADGRSIPTNALQRDSYPGLVMVGARRRRRRGHRADESRHHDGARDGIPAPQPEVAERYYRLAAHGGNEDAEYELARRLRAGVLITKPENGDAEALELLRRALSHGSARAAETLAEIYRNGELGVDKDPVKAVQYAFLAIKLSRLSDPTTRDGIPITKWRPVF